ncbi:OmpA family protein [Moraxella sp. K127]|uniref:OmpA family protein n=1 Tax=Moraxella sp. K127 TaxID=2780079 RepID=UPI0018812A51|nr:OmpA family protein [Moraxella sp. K127]MBE9591139.1 OmpA family protein [Moraxella sp. K127]
MQLKKLAFIGSALMMAIHAHADVRLGNQVTWKMSSQGAVDEFTNLATHDNAGGVVFIRPLANAESSEQSSTNIAINDRYLTSLQDGHYTSGVACAGNVQISAVPTGKKTNDLSAQSIRTHLSPKQIQYFVVQAGNNHKANLVQINANRAHELIQGVRRQAHQVSRLPQPDDCASVQYSQQQVTPPQASSLVIIPVRAETHVQPSQSSYVSSVWSSNVQPNQPSYAVQMDKSYETESDTLNLTIQFDHDKSHVKSSFQKDLSEVANFLKQHPSTNATIEGHTDSTGAASYNQKLSERRAKTVKHLLIKNHGIEKSRLSTIGHGESQPIATNNTQAGRYKNRRVVVSQ